MYCSPPGFSVHGDSPGKNLLSGLLQKTLPIPEWNWVGQQVLACSTELPKWLRDKESTCQCRRHGFDPWVGNIPWWRKWQSPPLFFLYQIMKRHEEIFFKIIFLKYTWFTMLCLISAVQRNDSVIHTYIFFFTFFLYSLSQVIEYNSLCYTVGLSCLSILYRIVCMCWSQTPSPFLPHAIQYSCQGNLIDRGCKELDTI